MGMQLYRFSNLNSSLSLATPGAPDRDLLPLSSGRIYFMEKKSPCTQVRMPWGGSSLGSVDSRALVGVPGQVPEKGGGGSGLPPLSTLMPAARACPPCNPLPTAHPPPAGEAQVLRVPSSGTLGQ